MTGKTAGVTFVFTASLACGALLNLDAKPVRELGRHVGNDVLKSLLVGQITIERIGHLGLDGLRGVTVRARDESGIEVVYVRDVDVDFDVMPLLVSLTGKGPIAVHVPRARIGMVDANLDIDPTDPENGLRIARAFQPKPTPPEPEPPPGATQPVHVQVDRFVLSHGWAHGNVVPDIDADVDDVDVRVAVATDGVLAIDMKNIRATSRGPRPGPSAPNVILVATGGLVLPIADGLTGRSAHVDARAEAGEAVVTATGKLENDDVTAEVDIPPAPPTAVSALVPGLAPTKPLSVHATAHGPLNDVEIALFATSGPGDVRATARLRTSHEATAITADVRARDIDLHAVTKEAPESSLGLRVVADAKMTSSGAIEGTYRVQGPPGRIAGQVVPAFMTEGTATGDRVTGDLTVDEDGAKLKARYDVGPLAPNARVKFDAEVDAAELAAIPRVALPVRGHAYVTTKGTVDLGAKTIDATVAVAGDHLDLDGSRIQRLEVHSKVKGPFDAITSRNTVRARGLSSGDQKLDTLGVDAKVALDPTGGVRVARLRIEAARADERATLTVASIDVGDDIRVQDGRLEGLGEALAFELTRKKRGDLKVKARTDGLSIARIASLVGSEDQPEGVVTMDVDLAATSRRHEGHAAVKLVGFRSNDTRANAELVARFDEHTIDATLTSHVDGIGDVAIKRGNVVLATSFIDGAAWKRALLDVDLRGTVDLAALVDRVRPGQGETFRAEGALTVAGHVARTETGGKSGGLPTARLVARTRGLLLDVNDLHLRGTDTEVVLDANANSGEVGVSFSAWDDLGQVARVDAKTLLPMAKVLRDPASLARQWKSLPVALRMDVPRREVDSLPGGYLASYEGEVELGVALDGTPEHPNLDLTASVEDLTKKEARAPSKNAAGKLVEAPEIAKLAEKRAARRDRRADKRDLDTTVHATYDGEHAEVVVAARQQGHERARIVAKADAAMTELLERGADAPWTASVDGDVKKLDLARIAFLPRGTQGEVDATISVAKIHDEPTVDVHVKLSDGSYERVGVPEATVDVTASAEEGLKADAKIRQEKGHANVSLRSGLSFVDGLTPHPEIGGGVTATYDIAAFRLSMLKPIVRAAIPEIDGWLDGQGKLYVDDKRREIDGTLAMRDGFFYVPALGEEVREVRLAAKVDPGGNVLLERLDGKIGSGRFDVKAAGVVDPGGRVRAKANIAIPSKYPLPVTVDGVHYGEVDTRATVAVDASSKAIAIDVGLPEFHFELSNEGPQKLQPLEEDDHMEIGRYDARGVLVPVPARKPEEPAEPRDATPLKIHVALGDKVYLTREAEIRVGVAGAIDLAIVDAPVVNGKIELREGFLELQGKRFEVERGTVTWANSNNIGNPQVLATASYAAPGTEYRVFADYAGSVESGKLRLRSEPALKEGQVLSLLLFDDPYGQVGGKAGAKGGGGNAAGQAATSVGAGFATSGLNKAIRDVADIDVVTKVGTDERTKSARPEIGVRVRHNLVLGAEVVTGHVPPTEERSFFKVDWRFVRNWSVLAKKGTRYATIFDVIWQYRY